MRVLICGGGVISASIAYFLSCRGVQSVVIERTGLACAASGKSGGFLALDWCDGTPLEPASRFMLASPKRLAATGAIVASPLTAASPALRSLITLPAVHTASSGCRMT